MKYDVIVILGGGVNADRSLPKIPKLRVEKGVELFKHKASNRLIMSGKGSSRKKDFVITEAKAMKKYAISLGVPSKNILLEENSLDTIGNAFFTKIKHLNPKNWKKVIIVTSNFHMRRTKLIFNFVLGKNYKIKYVKSSSKLSCVNMLKRLKTELKLTRMIKKLIDMNKAGDDKYIEKLLYTINPYYAKHS